MMEVPDLVVIKSSKNSVVEQTSHHPRIYGVGDTVEEEYRIWYFYSCHVYAHDDITQIIMRGDAVTALDSRDLARYETLKSYISQKVCETTKCLHEPIVHLLAFNRV
jgi:PDZ domain-containing secreted protein